MRLIALLLLLVPSLAWAQTCTTTLNAGAAVGTAISSAAAGATICLNNGNYAGFTLSGVTKSPRVTVRAVNSRQASFTSTVTVRSGSQGITFSGINMNGIVVGTAPAADTTREITFRDYTDSGGALIQNLTHATPNILLEDFTSNNHTAASMAGSARVWLTYDGSNTRSGLAPALTIRRAYMDGGCADGIQAGLAIILEYSVIANLQVGTCPNDPHTDAVQFYGTNFNGSQIRYNYFYCNVQALTAYDGVAGVTIEHNVFDPGVSGCGGAGTIERRPCQIEWYADNGSTIRFNTVIDRGGGYGSICLDAKSGQSGSGTQLLNNIAADIYIASNNTGWTRNKNLVASGATANDITGAPTFKGACAGQPSAGGNWVGCALANGSAGKNAATDGTDIGTHFYGLAAPTGLGSN